MRTLAAAALLALSGGLALPATAEAQTCTLNTGDLWCGVVTVAGGSTFQEMLALLDIRILGCYRLLRVLCPTPEFSVGTNPYTIDTVFGLERGSAAR